MLLRHPAVPAAEILALVHSAPKVNWLRLSVPALAALDDLLGSCRFLRGQKKKQKAEPTKPLQVLDLGIAEIDPVGLEAETRDAIGRFLADDLRTAPLDYAGEEDATATAGVYFDPNLPLGAPDAARSAGIAKRYWPDASIVVLVPEGYAGETEGQDDGPGPEGTIAEIMTRFPDDLQIENFRSGAHDGTGFDALVDGWLAKARTR